MTARGVRVPPATPAPATSEAGVEPERNAASRALVVSDEAADPGRSKPLFVVLQTYRRRRLADAARILPFIGAAGFFLPILWQPASTPAPDTAPGAVWLFGVWVTIILAALVMSRFLSGRRAPAPRREEG